MTVISICHRTTYRYRYPVSLSPHRFLLRPREAQDLQLLSHSVTISPPAELTWSQDVFGNAVATAHFQQDADMLCIESRAEVEIGASAWPVFAIQTSALVYPFRYSDSEWTDLGALAICQYPDPDDRLAQWARNFVASDHTDTLSLLKDLNTGVQTQIRYQARDDEGTQSPAQTLMRGWGACRDMAVLFAEAARSLGFGARIVSGYLRGSKDMTPELQNHGTTHAWAEIFVPGPGWIAFDPTNGAMGGANLIPTTFARDISQTMPITGSFVSHSDAFVGMEIDVVVSEQDAGGRSTPLGALKAGMQKEIYASTNGDRWLLIGDGNTISVRHEPNAGSGGKASDRDLGIFLATERHSPQGEGLLRLLGEMSAPHT